MTAFRLHQGLQQRQTQQMLMAPRMLQAIEVLQLPALELDAFLAQAAQENEALRVESFGGMGVSARSWEDSERHDEMLRNQPDRAKGLAEHALEQLALLDLDPELEGWVRFLATCLDDSGYLSVSDEVLLEEGRAQGLEDEDALLGRAIAVLQRLEPRGIGGRDMTEALLLQLDPRGPDYPLLCELVEKHLDGLAHNKLPAVARALGIELERLGDLMLQLRDLDPRPGATPGASDSPVVVPEVMVEESEDGYEVRLDRSALPAVSLDPDVVELAREREQAKEVKSYLKARLGDARWIVEAVEQRAQTLLRTARAIFTHQRAFLEHGPGHLVPLRMSSVAEELDLHVSTISRAVAGKYAQTPRGIFPLRGFFQASAGGGEDVARDEVSRAVQAVFEAEDPTSPLSDDEAAAKLAEKGFELARRTVAKYRKELGIKSSYQRRRFIA